MSRDAIPHLHGPPSSPTLFSVSYDNGETVTVDDLASRLSQELDEQIGQQTLRLSLGLRNNETDISNSYLKQIMEEHDTSGAIPHFLLIWGLFLVLPLVSILGQTACEEGSVVSVMDDLMFQLMPQKLRKWSMGSKIGKIIVTLVRTTYWLCIEGFAVTCLVLFLVGGYPLYYEPVTFTEAIIPYVLYLYLTFMCALVVISRISHIRLAMACMAEERRLRSFTMRIRETSGRCIVRRGSSAFTLEPNQSTAFDVVKQIKTLTSFSRKAPKYRIIRFCGLVLVLLHASLAPILRFMHNHAAFGQNWFERWIILAAVLVYVTIPLHVLQLFEAGVYITCISTNNIGFAKFFQQRRRWNTFCALLLPDVTPWRKLSAPFPLDCVQNVIGFKHILEYMQLSTQRDTFIPSRMATVGLGGMLLMLLAKALDFLVNQYVAEKSILGQDLFTALVSIYAFVLGGYLTWGMYFGSKINSIQMSLRDVLSEIRLQNNMMLAEMGGKLSLPSPARLSMSRSSSSASSAIDDLKESSKLLKMVCATINQANSIRVAGMIITVAGIRILITVASSASLLLLRFVP